MIVPACPGDVYVNDGRAVDRIVVGVCDPRKVRHRRCRKRRHADHAASVIANHAPPHGLDSPGSTSTTDVILGPNHFALMDNACWLLNATRARIAAAVKADEFAQPAEDTPEGPAARTAGGWLEKRVETCAQEEVGQLIAMFCKASARLLAPVIAPTVLLLNVS